MNEKIYTLFTRYEDGSNPITVIENINSKNRKKYEVKVGGHYFKTFKEFLNTTRCCENTSFNRYFNNNVQNSTPIIEILNNVINYKKSSTSKESVEPLESVVVSGIDIGEKKKDIERLFYSFFAKKAAAEGLPIDDLLQEIYKGILARNIGKGAWNPKRGSFGSYVHMVANSVYLNFRNKELKRGIREKSVDTSTSQIDNNQDNIVESDYINEEMLVSEFSTWVKNRKGLGDPAAYVVCLLRQGKKKKEIAAELGINHTTLHKIIDGLRQRVSEFMLG